MEDADSLILALDELIAKKRQLCDGLMHRCFATTPDTPVKSLGEVTTWLSGGTPDRSRADFWTGSIPWISAATLRGTEVCTSDQHVTEAGVRTGSRMAPVGATLLLVRGMSLHTEIRAAIATKPVCFNQDVKALVPAPDLRRRYLTYAIRGNREKLLALVTPAGNATGVLDTQAVKRFPLAVPGLAEQDNVVALLDDTFGEIGAFEARLEKARAIKEGMMQELLTGHIRLPIADLAPVAA